jgi:hypothetical protein
MAGNPIQQCERLHFLARHGLVCVALLVLPHDVSDGHTLAEVIKPEPALSIAYVGPHRRHDAIRPNVCSSPGEFKTSCEFGKRLQRTRVLPADLRDYSSVGRDRSLTWSNHNLGVVTSLPVVDR